MPSKTVFPDVDETVDGLTESGEPTIEARVVSDFLTHADFSALFESPDAKPYVFETVDEDGDEIEALDGIVVAQLVDEDDLAGMFYDYVEGLLAEYHAKPEKERTLEEKATFARLGNTLGGDLVQEFARGGFKKLQKKPGGRELVKRMIGAMLQKGAVKRAKGGKYTRGAAYHGNVKKSAKSKIARYKRANVSKVRKSAFKAKRALKRKKSESIDDLLLFGLGEPAGETLHEVSARNGAKVTEPAAETDSVEDKKPAKPAERKDEALDESLGVSGQSLAGQILRTKAPAKT